MSELENDLRGLGTLQVRQLSGDLWKANFRPAPGFLSTYPLTDRMEETHEIVGWGVTRDEAIDQLADVPALLGE